MIINHKYPCLSLYLSTTLKLALCLQVVGWGYDENNQVTEELKMARMPVVSYVTCLKSYPQFFSQFTAENKTFCAGFRQGL